MAGIDIHTIQRDISTFFLDILPVIYGVYKRALKLSEDEPVTALQMTNWNLRTML